jgi:hypothetical protein
MKRAKGIKDPSVTKTKLPTAYRSSTWPKCPICPGRLYNGRCIACGYTNIDDVIDEFKFIKASEAATKKK